MTFVLMFISSASITVRINITNTYKNTHTRKGSWYKDPGTDAKANVRKYY